MTDGPIVDETEVLKLLLDTLRELSPESRFRVLKTIQTFFNFEREESMPDSPSPYRIPQANREPSFGDRSSLSPKDFMHEKDPKTDVERVTCLAYYLTNYRSTPHFKTIDISKLNTEAAQFKLSNPSFTLENATKAGLLTQAGGGSKQISVYGDKVVLALPDRDKVREVLQSVRRRTNKKRSRGESKASNSNNTE